MPGTGGTYSLVHVLRALLGSSALSVFPAHLSPCWLAVPAFPRTQPRGAARRGVALHWLGHRCL